MFAVYFHDFKTKESKILKTVSNILEAHGYLEETIDNYLISKEGNRNTELYREPSYKGSRSWNNIPFGYVKTRNVNDSFYKITIWKKWTESGYLYNTVHIDKVLCIDIIKVVPCELPPKGDYSDREETDDYEKHEEYFISFIKPEIIKKNNNIIE